MLKTQDLIFNSLKGNWVHQIKKYINKNTYSELTEDYLKEASDICDRIAIIEKKNSTQEL